MFAPDAPVCPSRSCWTAAGFEPFGRHTLKGVPDEWDIYSVAGAT